MENSNFLFGELRTLIGYKTPSSMNKTWTAVFPGETMPEDHIFIPFDKAKTFLSALLEPKKGRSADITTNARQILRNINLQSERSMNAETTTAISEPVSEPVLAPVSEKIKGRQSASGQFFSEFCDAFHPSDLVFYGVVGIGCFGVSGTLPGVGIVIAALWMIVAVLVLHRCKVFSRIGDFIFLAFIEIVVGSLSHIAWANKALWENVKSLPITVYVNRFRDGDNQLVLLWQGETELPFYIACYVAFILVAFGGYAVAVSVLANRKRIKELSTPDAQK